MRKLYWLLLVVPLLVVQCDGGGDDLGDDGTEQSDPNEPSEPADPVTAWGLGTTQTEKVANNRSYSWYVDQYSTGAYWNANCGPSCVYMAGMWHSRNFPKTVAQLRAGDSAGADSNGWWYTNMVAAALTKYGADNYYVGFGYFGGGANPNADLKTFLDMGRIAVLCIDNYYVRTSTDPDMEHRKDKFYTSGGIGAGHFIVVKGYRKVDGEYLLEVYDPWSAGAKYADGQLKGKDRYYRAEDVVKAAGEWWPYAYIVYVPSGGGARGVEEFGALDPATVPVAFGR